MDSKALRALKARVKKEGWSTVDLAGKLSISQPTASRLIRGDRGPSLALGSRIERELGIETGWWALPPEESHEVAPEPENFRGGRVA